MNSNCNHLVILRQLTELSQYCKVYNHSIATNIFFCSLKVTRADVEVQPYILTTKSPFVSHMDYKYLRWQVRPDFYLYICVMLTVHSPQPSFFTCSFMLCFLFILCQFMWHNTPKENDMFCTVTV